MNNYIERNAISSYLIDVINFIRVDTFFKGDILFIFSLLWKIVFSKENLYVILEH